jgi:hypothetical protein
MKQHILSINFYRVLLLKQRTGGLVVRWVTTGESPLLYVFGFWPTL